MSTDAELQDRASKLATDINSVGKNQSERVNAISQSRQLLHDKNNWLLGRDSFDKKTGVPFFARYTLEALKNATVRKKSLNYYVAEAAIETFSSCIDNDTLQPEAVEDDEKLVERLENFQIQVRAGLLYAATNETMLNTEPELVLSASRLILDHANKSEFPRQRFENARNSAELLYWSANDIRMHEKTRPVVFQSIRETLQDPNAKKETLLGLLQTGKQKNRHNFDLACEVYATKFPENGKELVAVLAEVSNPDEEVQQKKQELLNKISANDEIVGLLSPKGLAATLFHGTGNEKLDLEKREKLNLWFDQNKNLSDEQKNGLQHEINVAFTQNWASFVVDSLNLEREETFRQEEAHLIEVQKAIFARMHNLTA